jgi:hypothetical protein
MNFNNWALGKLDLTSDRGPYCFLQCLAVPRTRQFPGLPTYNPGIVDLIVVLAIPGTVAAFCTAVLVQQVHRQARWPIDPHRREGRGNTQCGKEGQGRQLAP